jgi:hypothetical protein
MTNRTARSAQLVSYWTVNSCISGTISALRIDGMFRLTKSLSRAHMLWDECQRRRFALQNVASNCVVYLYSCLLGLAK